MTWEYLLLCYQSNERYSYGPVGWYANGEHREDLGVWPVPPVGLQVSERYIGAVLNAVGREGWELVLIAEGGAYRFKRPLQE